MQGASVRSSRVSSPADDPAWSRNQAEYALNIVIVDDQTSARTMLRHVIEDIAPELSVYDFGDPLTALAWCEAHPVDLLLLDYRMPEMDGLEFARRFRRLPKHRDIPVILITVVGDEPIRQAALEAGVIDFLVKPIRPRELRARCYNLLQLRQQTENVKQRALSLEQRLLASMHEVEERERETLSRLARAIEFRDAGTSAYLERMARVAGLIAEQLGLPEDDVRLIEMAGRCMTWARSPFPTRCCSSRASSMTRSWRSCAGTHASATSCSVAARTVSSRWARSSRCAITNVTTAAAIPTAWSAKRSRWKRGSLLSPTSSMR